MTTLHHETYTATLEAEVLRQQCIDDAKALVAAANENVAFGSWNVTTFDNGVRNGVIFEDYSVYEAGRSLSIVNEGNSIDTTMILEVPREDGDVLVRTLTSFVAPDTELHDGHWRVEERSKRFGTTIVDRGVDRQTNSVAMLQSVIASLDIEKGQPKPTPKPGVIKSLGKRMLGR